MEKARGVFADRFVRRGRLFGERVDAPVDVRVVAAVVVHKRIDDLARLLGRRRVVEVDEGLAVKLAVQDGKVLSDSFHV